MLEAQLELLERRAHAVVDDRSLVRRGDEVGHFAASY